MKNTIRFLAPAFLAWLSLACLNDAQAVTAPQAKAGVEVTDQNMIEAAKQSIREQQVYPDSVEYRNIKVHFLHKHTLWLTDEMQTHGYRSVCGELRSKGIDGKITPFYRFYFINSDTAIGMTDEEWTDNCSN